MRHTITHLSEACGELQGRLRLAADGRGGDVGAALARAADLVDEADRLLCTADLRMRGVPATTDSPVDTSATKLLPPPVAPPCACTGQQLTLFSQL